MVPCPKCSTLLEPWQSCCHQCNTSISGEIPLQVKNVAPPLAELEEAYTSWLQKGQAAFLEGQYEEACNALREAVRRSRPLPNGQEKETTARKALAESLEKLNKLQEAADQYRIIAQDSSSHRLREAWLKKSEDLVAASSLPYDLLFQKEEFRALQGDEILYVPLYCVGCKRLLAEAEVYGLRRGLDQTVRCWCGVQGRPLAKQDARHSLAMEEARAAHVSQRAIAIGVASKQIPGGRRKRTAIILAVTLGWIGGHKFYLGETTSGLIYAMWFWTLIPLLISLYEAIVLMEMNTTTFNMTYNIEAVLTLVDQPESKTEPKSDVFSMESQPEDVAETRKISIRALEERESS